MGYDALGGVWALSPKSLYNKVKRHVVGRVRAYLLEEDRKTMCA